MAATVTKTIEINRSVREVSSYACDASNDPVWITGIYGAAPITKGDTGVGTKVQRLTKFRGKSFEYILEVKEFVPEYQMVMQSIKSPFPLKVTYTFESLAPKKTPAQIKIEAECRQYYKLPDFIMEIPIGLSLSKDMKNLKRIMESKSY